MSNQDSFRNLDEAVVVDVETTGLDPKTARIVSVAALRVRFSEVDANSASMQTEALYFVVNPQCRIPRGATRVHGLKDRDVCDKPPFEAITRELRELIGQRPVVAHNVAFDKQILNAELKRAGVKSLSRNRGLCAMRRYQAWNHGRRAGSNLDTAAEVLEIGQRKRKTHDALEDAQITARIATLFFMMDNKIPIPGGAPKRPIRRGRARVTEEEGAGCGSVIAGAFVIMGIGAVASWLITP